jgi:hypothetical protein
LSAIGQRVLLLILLLLLLALGFVVVIAQTTDGSGQLPGDVQAALDEYLAPQSAAVLSADTARRPWLFTEEISFGAHGSSVHFQTEEYSNILSPLPFPPDQVWCVLLEQQSRASSEHGAERPDAVVLVALHIDMYVADWVVHSVAGDPFSRELETVLSTIGCDLGLY